MSGGGGAGLARRHPLLAGLACITAGVLAAAALLAGDTPLAFLGSGPAGVAGSTAVDGVADPDVVAFFDRWLDDTELVPGTVGEGTDVEAYSVVGTVPGTGGHPVGAVASPGKDLVAASAALLERLDAAGAAGRCEGGPDETTLVCDVTGLDGEPGPDGQVVLSDQGLPVSERPDRTAPVVAHFFAEGDPVGPR